MKTVSFSELTTKLQAHQPVILIEALPAHYFNQGHLPGAYNINVGEVHSKAPAMLHDKSADIVVYCASASCTNSDQVAMQLIALGYEQVAVFKGGKAAWEEAGRTLEGSQSIAL